MTRVVEVAVKRRQSAIAALRMRNPSAPEALTEDQVSLVVDEFALTANNVTYTALGDALRYWEFFPAGGGLGTVPVWGFAEVLASCYLGVEPGGRFYGYYPMVSYLLVVPTQVRGSGFVDASEHCRNLPSVHNQHLCYSSGPFYRASDEALQMLLRPLFATLFLLDDFLVEYTSFGATDLLLNSASSKTAIGLTFLLQCNRAQRGQGYRIVGLTSAGNRVSVEGLGCYDEVLAHDRLDALNASGDALSVDFTGNGVLLGQLHQRLGDRLCYSCLVGAAHWDQHGGLPKALLGPMPKLFSVPAWAEKRLKDWGGVAFQVRLAKVWGEFSTFIGGWIQVRRGVGGSEVLEVYQDSLAGRSAP